MQDAELPAGQLVALESLLAGQSVTETAEAVGVHRSTIHRWLDDPAFAAALECGLRDLRSSAQNRLLNLLSKAVDVVDGALDERDAKAALAVLRGIGLLGGPSQTNHALEDPQKSDIEVTITFMDQPQSIPARDSEEN